MGFGSHYVSSPGLRFSTVHYNEWMNKLYPSSDDIDEEKNPKWFFYHIAMNVKNI